MTRVAHPVGVITGTGVTEQFELKGESVVPTEFGDASVFDPPSGGYVIIPRHGRTHGTPPHAINYRANIAALEKLGVKEVIATSAVGSMNPELGVGSIGLLDQFLDFTRRRVATFFEDSVVHTDMTDPYSPRVNEAILAAAKRVGVEVRPHLVYVCSEGPRYETPAEVKMYRLLGGDVAGMTGVPEVVLAKEKGMEYASVAVATNWAAGMQAKVSHEEVLEVMKRSGKAVKQLIEASVTELRREIQ